MNRRGVVEGLLFGAIAGGTAFELNTPGVAAADTRTPRDGRRIVVFDRRFAAARRFVEQFFPHSRSVHGIAGDITPLWHDLLDQQWHRHATAIHGMTTPHAFHCLEQLTADRFWLVGSQVFAGPLVKWALVPGRIAS